jgi:dTDP-4-dehydrorhamnose reductase
MPSEGKPRILLLGSGGQLGMQLAKVLAAETELTALSRAELDFTDQAALRTAVRNAAPEIVINAAAYTAVDKAEQEPQLARAVNAIAPGVLADELRQTDGWLIHYSTDYVFDGSGTTPWRETDPTGPLSVYGQTKLDGELAIAASGCRHIVLRTSWVYAAEGRNFLHTMLRLGRERERLSIVDDQIGAPTSAEAIAAATGTLIQKLAGHASEASGVYHLTCGGATSWYGFARAIFSAFASRQKPPELLPIPTEAYPTPARRPHNSRLNCDKFAAEFGIRLPHWEEALDDVAGSMLRPGGIL